MTTFTNPHERIEELMSANEHCHEAMEKLAGQVVDLEAAKDGAYLERNKLVALLATLYNSGLKRTAIEGWSEDWHGCVYIDFPWGQASWHYHDSHAHLFEGLPPYAGVWDGHSTEQKYAGIEYATRLRIGLQKSQKNPFAPRGRGFPTAKACGET